MIIFFFFFESEPSFLPELKKLSAELNEVSSHIPNREELRGLIVAAANGDN